ncbi:MAG: hypothetical protein ACJAXK_002276 [Yoonia sp.]|jgi:hypothetical protein
MSLLRYCGFPLGLKDGIMGGPVCKSEAVLNVLFLGRNKNELAT